MFADIRWMIRRDMPEILAIERAAFEFPWTEDNFLNALRQRNCIGMVVEKDDRIIGHMVYELLKHQLHVLNFAVAPQCWRNGIGRQMAEKLVNKLSQQRRQSIILEVRETNLAAQLFFQRCGFKASHVLRGHYEDQAEDAYQLRYDIAEKKESIPFALHNRISAVDMREAS